MTTAAAASVQFERAAAVVRTVAKTRGYRITRCDRGQIEARLRGSKRVLRIVCAEDSASPLSPVGAVGLDAEILRDKIVVALMAEGLLS